MADQTATMFIAMLRKSRLLENDRIDSLVDAFQSRFEGAPPENPEPLVDFLIEKEALTRWQADKLLSGKSKGFFLGKYKLLRHLGSGGMSSVYVAEHVPDEKRGFYTGWLQTSPTLGIVVSLVVILGGSYYYVAQLTSTMGVLNTTVGDLNQSNRQLKDSQAELGEALGEAKQNRNPDPTLHGFIAIAGGPKAPVLDGLYCGQIQNFTAGAFIDFCRLRFSVFVDQHS